MDVVLRYQYADADDCASRAAGLIEICPAQEVFTVQLMPYNSQDWFFFLVAALTVLGYYTQNFSPELEPEYAAEY